MTKAPDKEWHSRGYLPHKEYEALQFVTFRLYDSLPLEIVKHWKEELGINNQTACNDIKVQQLRTRIARYEDAGYGQCFLKDPRIAALVQDSLLRYDGERYRLLGWCIMPNHVHVLIEMTEDWSLSSILQNWRSYTAHVANSILGRTGAFWMSEYFDRFIRNDEHLRNVIDYIDNNAVKAGLVGEPALWRWSSAGCGRS